MVVAVVVAGFGGASVVVFVVDSSFFPQQLLQHPPHPPLEPSFSSQPINRVTDISIITIARINAAFLIFIISPQRFLMIGGLYKADI